jgi:hypothetical protein
VLPTASQGDDDWSRLSKGLARQAGDIRQVIHERGKLFDLAGRARGRALLRHSLPSNEETPTLRGFSEWR